MESIPAPIADELARLERRLRWLTAVCVFLALGLVLMIGYRFLPVQPELDANEFRLVDRHGHVRGVWGQWRDGSSVFHLDGVDGRERLFLLVSADGSVGLRLLDSARVHRVFLQSGRDGWPDLDLIGPDDRPRLHLRTGPDGVGRIERWDANGRPIPGP